MTRRQELERHRHSLGEIRDIMNSMKTLAYMETRKLERFLGAQLAVVEGIEDIARDFVSFYPETLPEVGDTARVYLLIGTERGFCGDLNHKLVRHLQSASADDPSGRPAVVTVGRKLANLLEADERVAASIDGPSVAEEVPIVLDELVQELSFLQKNDDILTVYGIYPSTNSGITMRQLLPPFQRYLGQPQLYPHPPSLNVPPGQFLLDLTEHYLFAVLHEMLYTSLMMENHNRVTHLEGAVQHLDEESDALTRRCNAMRQEEIIEEIEVILLSAASVNEDRHKGERASARNASHGESNDP